MILSYMAVSKTCLAKKITVERVNEFYPMFVYPDDGTSYAGFRLYNDGDGFDLSTIQVNVIVDTLSNITDKLSSTNYDVIGLCLKYKSMIYSIRLEGVSGSVGMEATLQSILIVYNIMQDYFNEAGLDVNKLLRFMIGIVYKYYGSDMLELFVNVSANMIEEVKS